MISSESLHSYISLSSSSSSTEKLSILAHASASGAQKVKYTPDQEWDYVLENPYDPIDVSLSLPHYRAHNQPTAYRMGMLVAAHSKPVKAKVCRQPSQRSHFYLHVQAHSSDVTVWLPSDFNGRVSCTTRPAFSAGFVNRVMQNTRLCLGIPTDESSMNEDELVVCTGGKITLRMWDVGKGAVEREGKEMVRRMFGCGMRAPETTIDWDCLLDD